MRFLMVAVVCGRLATLKIETLKPFPDVAGFKKADVFTASEKVKRTNLQEM